MAVYPETRVQQNILKWLSWQHPAVRKYVIKIDNEGKRTLTGNVVAISAGLHVGASDLFIAWPMSIYHGIFLEVKPEGYKVTKSKQKHHDEQIAFLALMRLKNYYAEMIIGVDQGIDVLKSYLSLR